ILGIEKCLRKVNEGIGSKGFMKRRQKEEAAIKMLAKLLAKLRTQHWNKADFDSVQTKLCTQFSKLRTQLPPLQHPGTSLDRVAYSTLRCIMTLNEGQNWNFAFPGQGLASLKPNSTYMGGEQLKHKAYSNIRINC
ncbi:hypothetical protein PIB30_108878, partial [Stylosanthes scabra]|nr:hypothetical protein [Stylosanthes scabra]